MCNLQIMASIIIANLKRSAEEKTLLLVSVIKTKFRSTATKQVTVDLARNTAGSYRLSFLFKAPTKSKEASM